MKSVFKLGIKGIVVILPIIFVYIYTWMNPLGYMDEEAPYYMWNKEKVNTRQEKDYSVIILGDSTANAAYVPEILTDDTINLSLGGTTPVENYYILEDWLAHNNAPDVCYISFMDHHLNEEDCFWRRIVYSHRFGIEQIVEILKAATEYNEDSIICENYIADFISYELRLPNKYITSLMNAGFNQRHVENIEAWRQNDLHMGRYIGRNIHEGNISAGTVYDEFSVAPLFDDYLKKLIGLCTENDIQVRIVKLPLPEKESFTEKYIEDFYGYYESLKESFPNITVDWFSAYRENDFVDACHMNSHGALKFSKELNELYRKDFEQTELTSKQVEGINDYIVNENKIEYIIKWITGKNYTLIVNDKTGKFKAAYEEKTDDKNIFILEEEEGQEWDKLETSDLDITVIDDYDNIICLKSFKYEKEGFSLVQ